MKSLYEILQGLKSLVAELEMHQGNVEAPKPLCAQGSTGFESVPEQAPAQDQNSTPTPPEPLCAQGSTPARQFRSPRSAEAFRRLNGELKP